jgi:O-antigen/teichoic acid export membrane protein
VSLRRALGSSVIAHAVQMASSMISVPLFLRAFGTELYGYWGALLGLTSYLALLNFGIAQTVSSQASTADPADPDGIPRAVRAGLSSYARICAVALPPVAVVAALSPWGDWFTLPEAWSRAAAAAAVAVGVSFVLELPFSVFRAALHGSGAVATERFISSASVVLRLGAAWVFAHVHPPLWVAVLLLSVVTLSGHFACAVALWHRFPRLWSGAVGALEGEEKRRFRLAGWGFFVLQIAGAVIWATDAFIAGVVLGADAAARVSVAWRVLSIVLAVSSLVAPALAPSLAQAWATGDRPRASKLATQASQVLCGVTVVSALGMLSAGEDLFELWLGPGMFVGRWTWIGYVMILLVQAPLTIPHAFVTQAGLHQRYALVTVLEAALKLGLSVFLMRWLGLPGLPLGTLLARGLTTLWLLPATFAAEMGIAFLPWIWALARPLVASALAYGLLWFSAIFMGLGAVPVARIGISCAAGAAFALAFYFHGIDAELRSRLLSALRPPARRVT